MFKILKILLIFGGFFFLPVNCDKTKELQPQQPEWTATDRENPITPMTKMVLIKGGDYHFLAQTVA